MSMSKDDEQTKVLREILRWIRFTGMKEVKSVLATALDTDPKKLVYHLSDGNNGTVEIASLSGISDFTVRSYWKQWAKLGIVEAMKVGRGERYRRAFDLEDFGIEVPQAKAVTREGTIEAEGEGELGRV
jgi:hypothetical protein